MLRSIRWRIQLWHAAILLLVVASFGTLVYARLHRARFDEVETELQGAAQVLASVLQSLPPHEVGEAGPPRGPRRGPPPRGFGGPPPDGFGPPPNHPFNERPGAPHSEHPAQRHLELPAALLRHPLAPDESPPYFIVWRRDGRVLKQSADAPPRERPAVDFSREPETPRFARRGEVLEVQRAGPSGTSIVVGRSVRRELNELAQFRLLMIVFGVGVAALGAAGGFWLSHRALRPLRTMSDAAAAISASNLSQRIDAAQIDEELAHLAATLNAAFARLEDDFGRQSRFTADASHELRTPLTILLGHLELAVNQLRAQGDCSEAVLTAQRAAKRMHALVEGLLLLARADAGKLTPESRPFDLSETIDECVDLLQPLARQNHVELETELPAVEIVGDPRLVGQVAMNLVTNAIQHTPAGGVVTVALAVERQTAVLTVQDTGVGIAAPHLPRLFERFYRVDAARARNSGGLGLGLAIARSLVLAHGGEIACTSTPGHGSTFTVRLPRATPAPEPAAAPV